MNASPKLTDFSDKNRVVLIALAFIGAFQPTPIPLTFLHKLYLRQYGWSVLYFILGLTQISRVACAVEGCWYVMNPSLSSESGNGVDLRSGTLSLFRFPRPQLFSRSQKASETGPEKAHSVATAIRELEQLRQEGLVSEQEFEQKRRSFLDGI